MSLSDENRSGEPSRRFARSTRRAIEERTFRIAESRRTRYTDAEKHVERILSELGGGSIRNTFLHEFPFKWWILDFFLHEVRVGIEVDGGYHTGADQKERDARKTTDCEASNITMLRISNDEVLFGDRRALEERIVTIYKTGLSRTGGRFLQPRYTPLTLRPAVREHTPSPLAPGVSPIPEAITWAEAQLLKAHGTFYRQLDTGERRPETPAQKRFVDVCRGDAAARTMDEIAYVKLIRFHGKE